MHIENSRVQLFIYSFDFHNFKIFNDALSVQLLDELLCIPKVWVLHIKKVVTGIRKCISK